MKRCLAMLLLVPWMALAGGGYDIMSSEELRAEMARVQAELSAAAQAGKRDEALALGETLKAVAKAYGESFMRGVDVAKVTQRSRKALDLTPSGPQAEEVARRSKGFQGTWLDSRRLLEEGRVERALNLMEGVVGDILVADRGGLEDMTAVGYGVELAQNYLDLVRDTDRALAIARKSEQICDRNLSGPLDYDEQAVRTWLMFRQGVRAVLGRVLATRGETREMIELAEESARRWEVTREAYRKGRKPPYGPVLSAYFFGGTVNLATQLVDAGEALARRRSGADEARKLFERAQRILEEYLPTIGPSTGPMARFPVSRRATAEASLARIALELGDPKASRAGYERYLELLAEYRRLAPDHPVFDVSTRRRLALAELLLTEGEYERALELTHEADRDFEELKAAPRESAIKTELARAWRPAFVRARVLQAAGRVDEAIAAYQESIETFEGFYRKMRSGQMKGALLKIAECRQAYQSLIALLLAAGRKEEALAYLERSKSAVLLDMLRALPLRDRKNWKSELSDEVDELKTKIREQKKKLGSDDPKGTSDTRAAAVEELSQIRWQYELLLRKVDEQLQDKVEDGYDQVWYRPTEELVAASGRHGDRAVVTFFDDGEVVRAFVLRGGELTVHECGKSKEIERAVAKLRRNIAAKSRRWERPAQDLHEALIEPWQDRLEGAGELVVVPTGYLYALPFACLAPKGGEPLATRVPLSVTSQASLVADAAPETKLPKARLVVGDPDGSLPSARVEAKKIAGACPDPAACQLLVGEQATEGRLKALLGHSRDGVAPGVVHLATHGLLLEGRELFSTLVLAPDTVEDGALSVAEIYTDLDLRESPVVVLSACNTALGAEGGGDEIVGLSRGFQYAGARWVVASLWEVNDEASAALMEEFHRALATSGRVDQALAAAMARTRGASEEWAHPYYWAPFAAFRR